MSTAIPLPTYDLSTDLYWFGRHLSPEDQAAMRAGELSAEERAPWTRAGIEDTALIWGWKARRIAIDEALAWTLAGFLPSEADAYRDRGYTQEEACARLPPAARLEARACSVGLDQALWWGEEGFGIAEAAPWIRARLNPGLARRWQKQGFAAEEAAGWCRQQLNEPEEAGAWRKYGFAAAEAWAWKSRGQVAEVAAELRQVLGLAPEDPEVFTWSPGQVRRWREAGFPLREARDWQAAGQTPREASRWRQAGFAPEEARTWGNADAARGPFRFDADQAAAWRAQGYEDPGVAFAWQRRGLAPESARAWEDAGFPAEAAAGLRPLSPAVAAALRALGLDAVADIQAWYRLIPDPGQVAAWRELGLTPAEVHSWQRAGLADPRQVRQARARGQTPSTWRPAPPPTPARPVLPVLGRSESPQIALLFWGIVYPECQDRAPWADGQALDQWPARLVRPAPNASPEALGCHLECYGRPANFFFPYVAISASERRVGDHGRIRIPEVEAAWRGRLETFCRTLKIPFKEPGWHLAGLWLG